MKKILILLIIVNLFLTSCETKDYSYENLDVGISRPYNIVTFQFSNIECTGSMKPTFDCNDRLIVFKPEKEDVNIGDIIGFKKFFQRNIVIHRVVNIKNNNYITKGDSNDYIDLYNPKMEGY